MIRVGTCGFSYADWKGEFYPATIRPSGMLAYYADAFSAVEIDSTYYRVPPVSTFAGMAKRTPPGFRFSIKLPGSATHLMDRAPGVLSADVEVFRRSIEPLVAAGKCLAVLMQFPNAFHPTAAALAHLEALRAALPEIALVAEFRNRKWQTHQTLEFLRHYHIGWVNVDMPQFDSLMRPSADATGPVAYVRFHGRNYGEWWRGDNVTRYDYEYSATELEPWADRLIDLAANADVREVLSFFNNHRRGQATRNAKMFEAMVRSRYPAAVVTVASPPPVQLGFDTLE